MKVNDPHTSTPRILRSICLFCLFYFYVCHHVYPPASLVRGYFTLYNRSVALFFARKFMKASMKKNPGNFHGFSRRCRGSHFHGSFRGTFYESFHFHESVHESLHGSFHESFQECFRGSTSTKAFMKAPTKASTEVLPRKLPRIRQLPRKHFHGC